MDDQIDLGNGNVLIWERDEKPKQETIDETKLNLRMLEDLRLFFLQYGGTSKELKENADAIAGLKRVLKYWGVK